jgi:predicted O-methyltransferase YrrM
MSELARELIAQSTPELAAGRRRVAVLGDEGAALEVATALEALGASVRRFDSRVDEGEAARELCPWAELADFAPQLVVIAADAEKELLLRAAAEVLDDQEELPVVVLAGLAHQKVRRELFEELEAPALVPSYATGHPHTRRHLYDCLRFAAAHGLSGAVVELGAFKGGTSVWLARAVSKLGLAETKVIGFDAWQGFPPRRSLLDLYEHPRCVFDDLDAVRAYTEPHGVELVVGDIYETAPRRLAEEPVLLAFIDTDNYSGTRAALEPILANLVSGGAIVFDHFHTTEEYPYTVGERIAASEILGEAGLLHLHGTGVFVKAA